MRTINKLEVDVTQVGETKYQIQFLNYGGSLPIDIKTDTGVQRTMIDKKGLVITNSIWPVIDPNVYYLKKVIQE